MRRKPAKGFLIGDVERRRVIDRGTFVGCIERGQTHVAEGSLCRAFYPADIDGLGEFDGSRKDARVSNLLDT